MMAKKPAKTSPAPGPAPGRQSDRAYDVIRGEIVLCRLAPGSRFSEAELSERLGLARAATRAALTRLAEARLVQPVPRHGFVVTPITVASIRELFELRLILEPKAAALAAGRIDVARLRALDRAPQHARTEAEQLAFVESNRAFHREIAAAAGNRRLFDLLETLADEMQRLVHFGLFGPGRTRKEQEEAEAEHDALVAAFAARDAEAAERAARLHIAHSQDMAMQRLAAGRHDLALG